MAADIHVTVLTGFVQLQQSWYPSIKMQLHMGLIFLITLVFATSLHAKEVVQERPDWQKFFTDFKAEGTIVVADERETSRAYWVFNPERAQKRYSPASTFKIPHTLFALDAGVLRDEFQLFKWDGVPRSFAGHNQDQNLRSAMRNSTIWVYEIFAKQIGEKKAKRYLQKINYGNADPSTSKSNYWVDGNLQITAHEQVEFLKKLYRNQLPFKLEHQRLLKDVMIMGAGRDWILRSKTGWDGKQGWWVGWVERPNGAIFFALNMDTPNRLEDLYKREAITRAILQSIEAIPAN
jgi:beta-lactamase class D OXA-2